MSTEDREKRRILVIDDDEVMRELLGTLLKVQGYKVEVAGSGEEALILLRDPDPPTLILTDLQMPGLEGAALTAALREAAQPGTLILGMSGRRPVEAVLRPLDAFLPKPFSSAKLEEAILAVRQSNGTQSDASRMANPPSDEEQATPTPADSDLVAPEFFKKPALEEPALDQAIFSSLAKTFQPGQLLELYGLTVDDVRQRHARMETHAAAGDFDAVKREAHAIKGACGMVGARELQRLAAALEGGTTSGTSTLKEIPAACDRLRRMLDAKLQP